MSVIIGIASLININKQHMLIYLYRENKAYKWAPNYNNTLYFSPLVIQVYIFFLHWPDNDVLREKLKII